MADRRTSASARLAAAGWFALVAAWLVPDHYPPWEGFHAEVFAFAALMLLVGSVLFDGRKSVVVGRAERWACVLIAIPWVQHGLGIIRYSSDAILASMYIATFLLAVGVGRRMAAADGRSPAAGNLVALMWALWLGAVVSGFVAIVQWLGLTTPLDLYLVSTTLGTRSSGNLSQANHLGTLLLMGVVACACLHGRERLHRYLHVVSVALLTWGMVLSQSRTALLSAAVLVGWVVLKNRQAKLRPTVPTVLLWFCLLVLASLCLPLVNDALLLSGGRALGEATSVGLRWQMWRQMFTAIALSPWVGYGWAQTAVAYAAGAAVVPGEVIYIYAHNGLIDLLVWNGVIVGGVLILLMAWWCVRQVRVHGPANQAYAMAAALPVMVHSLLEFPFAYAYFLVPLGLLVGFCRPRAERAGERSVGNAPLFVLYGLGLLVGGVVVRDYLCIEEEFRTVRLESQRIGVSHEAWNAPRIYLLDGMSAMLKASHQVPAPGMAEADIRNLEDASRRYPYAGLRLKYVLALALNYRADEVPAQLRTIEGMYGADYLRLVETEIRRMAPDSATAALGTR